MIQLFFIVMVFLTMGGVCSNGNENLDMEYAGKLPPVYSTDFTRCTNETNARYCIAHISLKPIGPEPLFWKLIKERKNLRNHYDRSLVERAICISRITPNEEIEPFVNKILESEFMKFNLTHEINMLECQKVTEDNTRTIKIIGFSVLSYLVFVILATIYDSVKTPQKIDVITEWFLFFSLTSNWNRIVNHKKTNPDYQRLEFFQGIRFFNTNLVLACHNKLVWTMVFLKNTEFIENIFNNKLLFLPTCLDFFVVQAFFLISSWLVTNQILEIHKSNGEFTIKDGVTLLFNRIMRYFPTLAVLTIMLVSPIPNTYLCEGTLMFGFIGVVQKACLDNWWMTILQINNFAGAVYKICHGGTWYISIDTQYYLITILILYLTLKFKWNPIKTLAFMIVMAVGLHGLLMYRQNLQSIQWCNIEKLKRHKFLQDTPLESQYFSFYSSWSTSLIGTCLGMAYFYIKDKKNVQPFEKIVYPLAFSTLPFLAILLALFPFGPSILASIVGSLLKPIWSVGIGLGLLGISRNAMPGVFGVAKKVSENKLAVLLGGFSYSTYIIHFQIVFMRGMYGMLEANIYTLISTFFVDIVVSWIAGIVFALLVEQPGVNILKKFLPEVRKRRTNKELINDIVNIGNAKDVLNNNNYKNK